MSDAYRSEQLDAMPMPDLIRLYERLGGDLPQTYAPPREQIESAIRELVHAHPDADDAKAPT